MQAAKQIDIHPDSQMIRCTDMQPTEQIPAPADKLADKCRCKQWYRQMHSQVTRQPDRLPNCSKTGD